MPQARLGRGEVFLKQRQLRDTLLLPWHCKGFCHEQLARQLTDKRRHLCPGHEKEDL